MRLRPVTALVVTAALAACLAGTAAAHSPNGTATYVRIRPDPRMCPSPMCGGWWVRRVNRDTIVCGNGQVSPECYAAMLRASDLEVDDEVRTRLVQGLVDGTALLRGRLRRGSGGPLFAKYDTLAVTEIWRRYGPVKHAGAIYRVEDNGVRCVRAPCFSLHASVLNTERHLNVSSLDLASSGASAAAIRRADAALDDTGLMVQGSVVAGPEGARTLRATVFWLRAA